MPDYPQAETDVHTTLTKPAPALGGGTGSYQTGTAPKTAAQQSGDLRQAAKARAAGSARQKVRAYAPGSDPSIKGRTSFSDEMGD